jgi:hypothetical protein
MSSNYVICPVCDRSQMWSFPLKVRGCAEDRLFVVGPSDVNGSSCGNGNRNEEKIRAALAGIDLEPTMLVNLRGSWGHAFCHCGNSTFESHFDSCSSSAIK